MVDNYEKQLTQILDNFDFGRVHEAMLAMEWKWGGDIPGYHSLMKCAEGLLRDAVKYAPKSDTDWVEISTGGFTAQNRNGRLLLMFCIADYAYESGDVDNGIPPFAYADDDQGDD
jgi:hypothetical protein